MPTTWPHVQVLVNATPVDACNIALPLSIIHGRSDIATQPDPPTTQFQWWSDTCPFAVGDTVDIDAATAYLPATYDDPIVTFDASDAVYDSDSTGLVWHRQFSGVIAAITAQSGGGTIAAWTIDAVGHLARLGTLTLTDVATGRDDDVERVRYLCDWADVTINIAGSPTVALAPAVLTGDLLSLLYDVCTSSGGLLWQARDGSLWYGTANHRATNPDPVGVIDCDAIVDDIVWAQTVEEIVNEVTVSWGPPDATQTATHRDDQSIAEPWGRRAIDVATGCADEAEADQLALLILARRAFPFWHTDAALLALTEFDPTTRLFSHLDVSTPVLVPIPNTPGATPADLTTVVVEGWIETWDETGAHTAQAALSDQSRWVATTLRTYGEVLAGGTYGHWRSAGDYLHMLVKEVP